MKTDTTSQALGAGESLARTAYPSDVDGDVANRSAGIGRRFEPIVAA